jgi:hypothetical protein
VQVAVERLLAEYSQADKTDHFRVLYGRICDESTMPEIAEALGISVVSAEGRFRDARRRLEERLREVVRDHVVRYSAMETAENDFCDEWVRLGDYLQSHGGLEQAIRESYAALGPQYARKWITRAELADCARQP